ncbi:MAG: ATPase, partial [Acidobacteria bacterium]|nr:ATPase [Acidobacteriota bacterium]
DGGQSSTTALIGEESGRVLGAGSGGPCNHAGAAGGREKLARAVNESVGSACARAGLDPHAAVFECACFGMSGGPADKQAILEEILPAASIIVTTDAVIALSGATGGGPGIIMIAGTGSIAFGRNAGGKTARAGGWGYVFGDEGGGFDIARQALRAALRFEEGWGPATALYRTLLDATGAPDANDLLHRFYTEEWPRPRIASLARLVDQTALSGDPLAGQILLHAAQDLAELTASVKRQLWQPQEIVAATYIGGVFRSQTLLERYRLLLELDGSRCAPPVHGPAAGALLEAYRACGLHPKLSDIPEFKT